jgi:hypothetical protein
MVASGTAHTRRVVAGCRTVRHDCGRGRLATTDTAALANDRPRSGRWSPSARRAAVPSPGRLVAWHDRTPRGSRGWLQEAFAWPAAAGRMQPAQVLLLALRPVSNDQVRTLSPRNRAGASGCWEANSSSISTRTRSTGDSLAGTAWVSLLELALNGEPTPVMLSTEPETRTAADTERLQHPQEIGSCLRHRT